MIYFKKKSKGSLGGSPILIFILNIITIVAVLLFCMSVVEVFLTLFVEP